MQRQKTTLLAALLAAILGCGGDSPNGPSGDPPGDPATVTVDPPPASIHPGQSLQLTVTVRDGDGKVVAGATVSWQSQTPNIASVDQDGIVKGLADGVASIRASSQGVNTTVSVTVQTPAPVFYSTLDDMASLQAPARGSGTGSVVSTVPANDFVPARVGNGLRLDGFEIARIPQIAGNTRNVEQDRGTIELWYRPGYDHDDDGKYRIVGTGSWRAPGSLHIGNHNPSNNNDLYIILWDANLQNVQNNVRVNDFQWNAGEWVLLRVTWDFTVPAGVQNVHVYMNGVETPLSATANGEITTGPQLTAQESTASFVSLGTEATSGGITVEGLFDELRIWDVPLPPPGGSN